jgi:hypothetical protein
MIPTTYLSSGTAANTHHEGVERVTAGLATIGNAIAHTSARKALSRGVVGVGTMAAITFAERMLDQAHTGFAAEMVILSAVAVLAYVALRAFVVPALRLVTRGFRAISANVKRQAEEDRFIELARRDPRIMNDLLAAKGMHEQFVDESPTRATNHARIESDVERLVFGTPWRVHANMM